MIVDFTDSVAATPAYINLPYVGSFRPDPATRFTFDLEKIATISDAANAAVAARDDPAARALPQRCGCSERDARGCVKSRQHAHIFLTTRCPAC